MSGELFWWFRIRGTVISSLWWKLLLILIYTYIIVYVHFNVKGYEMNFPQTLIPIIGIVVGLLLGFRTNSAYDRYWEGRKLWSQMTQEVRKLTRSIWVGVNSQDTKTLLEKKSALNLVLAFVISTKHYLREEYSPDYADLYPLIKSLPNLGNISTSESVESNNRRSAKLFKLMAYDHHTPTNIPVQISLHLLNYIKHVENGKMAPGWIVTHMHGEKVDSKRYFIILKVISNIGSGSYEAYKRCHSVIALSNLVDCISNFERILRTPMPLAYSVHLHYCVWLYILSLPYQILGTVGYWTIPVMFLGSFCLLGILSIGYEIENPFGYDDNDLPLDDFCRVMKKEIDVVVASDLNGIDWIYSTQNNPFGNSTLNFRELSSLSQEDLKKIIASSCETDIESDNGSLISDEYNYLSKNKSQ